VRRRRSLRDYTATCNATFRGVAAGARLLTVNVEVWPVPGRSGTIVVVEQQPTA
jgi:hypothetical protein